MEQGEAEETPLSGLKGVVVVSRRKDRGDFQRAWTLE